MSEKLHVLVVEDNSGDVDLIREYLSDPGSSRFKIDSVSRLSEAIARLEGECFDLLIIDLGLPDSQGLQTFSDLQRAVPNTPKIILTGHDDEETAITAVRNGAQDYITKNEISGNMLVRTALYAVERKLAETRLRERESKLRALFEILPVGVSILDAEHKITFVNSALERISEICKEGLLRGDYTGRTYLRPDGTPMPAEEFASIRVIKEQRAVHNIETGIVKEDGNVIWTSVSAAPVNFPDWRVLIVTTDITERKRAEEALRESEEKYRTLVENASEAILIIQDGMLKFVNHAACEISGYSKKELRSSPFLKLVHPEDREMVGKRYARRLNGDVSIPRYAFRVIAKDGTLLWLEVDAVLVTWEGNPATLNFISDITKRKRAEEELKNSEERFKLIFEFAPDAYYLTDLEGNFIDGNRAAERITGYKREELIGKSFLKLNLLSQGQFQKAAVRLASNAMGESTGPDEFVLEKKNGNKVPVEITTHPVRFKDRTVVLGIARDITKRMREEGARRQAEENFRRSLDESPLGKRIVSAKGETLYANQAILDIYGYSDIEELRSTPAKKRYTRESYAAYQLRKKKRVSGQDCSSEYEISIIRKSGEIRHLRVFRKAILWNNQKQFQAIYQDITEQKKAEEALKESEHKFKTIFDKASDGMFLVDLETRKFSMCNAMCLQTLGYAREEFLSLEISDIHPLDDLALVYEQIAKFAEGKEGVRHDLRFRRKDGSLFFADLSPALLTLAGRKSLLIVYKDITERKKADEKLRQTLSGLRIALGGIIQVLSAITEKRDPYTAGHQKRVADLARAIGQEMGLAAQQVEGLRMAGIIHDIGKVSVPAEILSNPNGLTKIEYEMIKSHPQIGHDILKDIDFSWPIAEMILQHHERTNGSGYPRGLKGDDILLEARILAVSDVVEAMASHRPYRPALGIEAALEEIEKNKGILYDPIVVTACLTLFREQKFSFK